MAGPIQTAIGQALGAVASVAAVGTKLNEDKRQVREKEQAEANKKAKAEADAKETKKQADAKEKAERFIANADEKIADAKKEQEAADKAKQAEEKGLKEQEAARVKEAADMQEADDVATEADLRLFGASEEAAKAYLLAQKRGTASPNRILFDEAGKPIATYEEMATILADESLTGTISARLRGKDAIKQRRMLLEGKTHKERVQNAILAEGGSSK